MRICICDDDEASRRTLRSLILPYFPADSGPDIVECAFAEELIRDSGLGKRSDIIFLDIAMGGVDGIEAARRLRLTDPSAIIIFVSSYSSRVFEAFSVDALNFLVKPVETEEFRRVFTKALNKYREGNATVAVRWEGERYLIKVDDILFVESRARHVIIHTAERDYETVGRLPDLMVKLSSYDFVRVHQGYLVNMAHIRRFCAQDVLLSDGTSVAVSSRRRAAALAGFDDYLLKRKF